ncbi:hypothetical protein [Lacticaseibacillus saniviri]
MDYTKKPDWLYPEIWGVGDFLNGINASQQSIENAISLLAYHINANDYNARIVIQFDGYTLTVHDVDDLFRLYSSLLVIVGETHKDEGDNFYDFN